MTSVAIVYHSGCGHTAKQAEAVAEGARRAGAAVRLFRAEEFASPDEGPWDALARADGIVFGSPTYMGSATAELKRFMELSSKIWFAQGWRDKLAAGFTNSGSPSGDKLATLQQLQIFAAQHGMNWVNLGLPPGHTGSDTDWQTSLNRLGVYIGAAAFSHTDLPPDAAPGGADLEVARHLGARVAGACARLSSLAPAAFAS